MKTLLLLLTISLKAQISIYYVHPAKLCPGDTLTILFKWDKPEPKGQINIGSNWGNQIFSVHSNTIHLLPKTVLGTDTVYQIKTPTWTGLALGFGTVSPDWVTTTPIYFECVTTGIMEYETHNELKLYDVHGRESKEVGVLLFSRDRRKFVIVE